MVELKTYDDLWVLMEWSIIWQTDFSTSSQSICVATLFLCSVGHMSVGCIPTDLNIRSSSLCGLCIAHPLDVTKRLSSPPDRLYLRYLSMGKKLRNNKFLTTHQWQGLVMIQPPPWCSQRRKTSCDCSLWWHNDRPSEFWCYIHSMWGSWLSPTSASSCKWGYSWNISLGVGPRYYRGPVPTLKLWRWFCMNIIIHWKTSRLHLSVVRFHTTSTVAFRYSFLYLASLLWCGSSPLTDCLKNLMVINNARVQWISTSLSETCHYVLRG
jgi:hypothetical protein